MDVAFPWFTHEGQGFPTADIVPWANNSLTVQPPLLFILYHSTDTDYMFVVKNLSGKDINKSTLKDW